MSILVVTMLCSATLFAQPAYRTFSQADLSQKKGKAGKLLSTTAWFQFPDTFSTATLRVLHVRFNGFVSGVVDSGGMNVQLLAKGRILQVSGRDLHKGDTVTLGLLFDKRSKNVQANYWYWDTTDLSVPAVTYGQIYGPALPVSAIKNYVQPTGGDVLDFLYKKIVSRPQGVVVGIPSNMVGVSWIRYMKADRMYFPHTDGARCFDLISKRAGEIKNPKVKKYNNHLLGELHALKLAVIANNAGITQPQAPATPLGQLIYSDAVNTANPFNQMTIEQIIHFADSAFTFCGYFGGGSPVYGQLDSTISQINATLSGPITAVSFTPFVISGAQTLATVPFLHPNPNVVPIVAPTAHPSYSYDDVPAQSALSQNYPNPFNPSTTIEFTLAEPSMVTLKVYNILGQEIATLIDGEQLSDGEQSVEFTASALPSGLYFYKMTAQGMEEDGHSFQAVKRMMLLK